MGNGDVEEGCVCGELAWPLYKSKRERQSKLALGRYKKDLTRVMIWDEGK